MAVVNDNRIVCVFSMTLNIGRSSMRLISVIICTLFVVCAAGQSAQHQQERITALVLDEAQNLYLGSTSGLVMMDPEAGQATRMLSGVPISALAWARKYGVFAAGTDNKIYYSDGTGYFEIPDPEVSIRCMMISGAQLWVGTNRGVYVISLTRERIADHFTPENSVLASMQINTMYADPSGVKWIGTDRGVIRAERDKRWRLYERDVRFTAITGNSEGAWLAGDREMWLVDPYNRWTPTAASRDLSEGPIRGLAADRRGRIYIVSDIFVQFDPYTDEVVSLDGQLPEAGSGGIALAFDRHDKLWVATPDEIIRTIDPEIAVVESAVFTASVFLTHPTCHGRRDGSIEVRPQGGRAPFHYAWSTPILTGGEPRRLDAGTYELTVTDAVGRIYQETVVLYDPDRLSAIISLDQAEEDRMLTAEGFGGRGDFNYLWSDGRTTRQVPVIAGGIYRVTITDANGCSAESSIEVEEIVVPVAVVEEHVPEAEPEDPEESVTIENIRSLDAGRLNVGQVLRIEQLQFEADSSRIIPASFPILDEISSFLATNEHIIIEIGGHTNGLPDHEYCDRLSTARARSVAQYIYSKGIPEDRVTYHGYGKRQPIATNETIAGRRKNQRVEVKILQM